MDYESLLPYPVIGGVIAYLYRKLNNKISRAECMRVHEMIDKRLEDIHDDIKFIKEEIVKR